MLSSSMMHTIRLVEKSVPTPHLVCSTAIATTPTLFECQVSIYY